MGDVKYEKIADGVQHKISTSCTRALKVAASYTLFTLIIASLLAGTIMFGRSPRGEAALYASASHGTQELECWVISQDAFDSAYLFNEPVCDIVYRQIPTDWEVAVNASTPCWTHIDSRSCISGNHISLAKNLPLDTSYSSINTFLIMATLFVGVVWIAVTLAMVKATNETRCRF